MASFCTFDVCSDASDHYFVDSNSEGKGLDNNVRKKIMKEWTILQENLPESIFVRVYEDRIDLLRAAIIGSSETPYYNGLFFFDVCFPGNYPAQPPTVHYHSFGLRMNPNLYNSGYVCLSLLNTWSGWKEEQWNKHESTVLQILLSLQALVLNKKPYYNEPGRINFPGLARKWALAYNENTWLNTCRTMLYLLRKPPSHFEKLVETHFRENAPAILNACQAYVTGRARVGYQVTDTSSSSNYMVSKSFINSMSDLFPLLLSQFEHNGTSVGSFRGDFMPDPKALIMENDLLGKTVFMRVKQFFGYLGGEESE